MGGYGSGRGGGTATAEGCNSYTLSAKTLRRMPHNVPEVQEAIGRGSITFSDGFTVKYVATVKPGERYIELTHETRDGNEREITYRVNLLETPCPLGGYRWWFSCPFKSRRAFMLFLPAGASRFASRSAYRLGYACQRETRFDRLTRKARKLHRQLGGDWHDDDYPPKPKWQRWRTYERKMAALQRADQRADDAWGVGAMRLLERAGVYL